MKLFRNLSTLPFIDSGDKDARWKYPNLWEIDTSQPKWRRREIERERLRGGYFKDMDWTELRRDPDTHA